MHSRHAVGIARPIGTYRDAIEVAPGQCFLGDARPDSMLLAVAAPVRPDFLLEVVFCAAAPAR